MNSSIFENDKNTDNEHDIADDLRNGVLERALQSAVDQDAREKEPLRARGNPKDDDEQRDKQKELNETEADSRQRRAPRQRNARGINGIDGKKDERGKT